MRTLLIILTIPAIFIFMYVGTITGNYQPEYSDNTPPELEEFSYFKEK
jgi:hypothetical protein